MCTLIIVRGLSKQYPVILAGNRDEFYHRPTRSPGYHFDDQTIFGGFDEVAGGTWMGVARRGLACALVNQRTADIDATKKSRGEIVTKVLELGCIDRASAWLKKIEPTDYNPFHLCVTDGRMLLVMRGTADPELTHLGPGLWVLTNDGLDSNAYPKVGRINDLFGDRNAASSDILDTLQSLLGDVWYPNDVSSDGVTIDDPAIRRRLHAICVHTPFYGTRSSTIVAFDHQGGIRYLHADGSPDQTAFHDLTPLLLNDVAQCAGNRTFAPSASDDD
ncbi:MAG: NRDE family protein [Myxococcota bacterium]|nr:NRDE family protein [Myxococcota bacterium]